MTDQPSTPAPSGTLARTDAALDRAFRAIAAEPNLTDSALGRAVRATPHPTPRRTIMEPTPIPDPTTRYQSPDDFPQPPDGCIVCTECGGLTLTATAEIHKLWHREI